jgi:hypothetical protein
MIHPNTLWGVGFMEATQLELIVDNAIGKNSVIQVLKDEQQRQGTEQHRQGVLLEDIQSQIQMIAEAVTPLLRSSEEMPEIKSTITSHRQDITITQQALNNHIKDPNAHKDFEKS